MCVLMEHLAKKEQAYELILPDIMSLRIDELRRLINTATIASLHLGNTPHIKLRFIVKLVSSSSIQHLTHPLLYSRNFGLTIGSQFAKPESSWSKEYKCGDSTNFPLRQIVYVTTLDGSVSKQRLYEGGIKWSEFAGGPRGSGGTAIALPMEDTLTGLDRFMKFIPMALHRLASARDGDFRSASSTSSLVAGIAKQAAVAKDLAVSCVPSMTLATWTEARSSSDTREPKAQFIAPGEWTLVLCHERRSGTNHRGYIIRHAFASMDKDRKSIVLSAPEFFARVLKGDKEATEKLVTEWQQQMRGIYVCDAGEVLEAMTLALRV